MKGYQLIEEFSFFSELSNSDKMPSILSLDVLAWVVCRLRNEDSLRILPIEIDLVHISYFGVYPGIGIHYLDVSIGDCQKDIINLINKYFEKISLGEFCEYFSQQSDLIIKIVQEYKDREV